MKKTIDIILLFLTALYVCSIPLYLNSLYVADIADADFEMIKIYVFIWQLLGCLFIVYGLLFYRGKKLFKLLFLLTLPWVFWNIVVNIQHFFYLEQLMYCKHVLFVFFFLMLDQNRIGWGKNRFRNGK